MAETHLFLWITSADFPEASQMLHVLGGNMTAQHFITCMMAPRGSGSGSICKEQCLFQHGKTHMGGANKTRTDEDHCQTQSRLEKYTELRSCCCDEHLGFLWNAIQDITGHGYCSRYFSRLAVMLHSSVGTWICSTESNCHMFQMSRVLLRMSAAHMVCSVNIHCFETRLYVPS